MIPHGLGASWGGGMIVKNPPPGGVMIVKTGGGMILKNPAPDWGHVYGKSHPQFMTSPPCGAAMRVEMPPRPTIVRPYFCATPGVNQ
jgi:hypothetical protein